MRTAKKISSIELSDWQGQRVRLETLWKEQPIVLVFIRHFG
jgi:cytochrome oxidase Cu insertion factor (SCO1/SenC/PrrC family)